MLALPNIVRSRRDVAIEKENDIAMQIIENYFNNNKCYILSLNTS